MDIATTRVPVARLPWRQLGVLALLTILLAAALALYAGAQRPQPPAPFGPAGNGLIAYSRAGDIFTIDPATGGSTAVVSGPDIDVNPLFSRDGTQLAFLRRYGDGDRYRLMVADADGSEPREATAQLIKVDDVVEWSSDGTALLMATSDGTLTRRDLKGSGEAAVLVDGVRWLHGEIRPPDGTQLLYEPDATEDIDLWIMNTDGTGARLLYRPPQQRSTDLNQVRWSPDGSMIAFGCAPAVASQGDRICVMNADGTGVRQLTDQRGAWVETDFVWSPDSRRIAFNRWRMDASGEWHVHPIGVASVDDPTVTDLGPAPAPEGALFDWSPDGTTLLSLPARFFNSADPAADVARPVSIDTATGAAREVDWEVTSNVSWQRVAP
jgi:dipeptidyl aminopeptidase/acylaminoacyl peptidase